MALKTQKTIHACFQAHVWWMCAFMIVREVVTDCFQLEPLRIKSIRSALPLHAKSSSLVGQNRNKTMNKHAFCIKRKPRAMNLMSSLFMRVLGRSVGQLKLPKSRKNRNTPRVYGVQAENMRSRESRWMCYNKSPADEADVWWQNRWSCAADGNLGREF